MNPVLAWTYYTRGAATVLFALGVIFLLICMKQRLDVRGRKFAPIAGATAFGGLFYGTILVHLYYPLHQLFSLIGLPSLVTGEGAALWGAFVGLHWSLAVVIVFGYRVVQWIPSHRY